MTPRKIAWPAENTAAMTAKLLRNDPSLRVARRVLRSVIGARYRKCPRHGRIRRWATIRTAMNRQVTTFSIQYTTSVVPADQCCTNQPAAGTRLAARRVTAWINPPWAATVRRR